MSGARGRLPPLAARDVKGAESRRALASMPAAADAWSARGAEDLARGDLSAAIRAFGRRVSCDAGSADAAADLGVLLDMSGDRGRAITWSRRAVALAPASGPKLRNLGILERGPEESDACTTLFVRATVVDDRDAQSWQALGDTTLQRSETVAAERSFRRAAALAPGSGPHWLGLGIAQQRRDKVADAVTALRRATSIEPLSVSGLANLAVAEHQAGRRAAADRFARAAAALDPARAIAWTCLGIPMIAEDRRADARRLFRRALLLDPALAEPAVNLALLDLLERNYVAGWQGFERRWHRVVYGVSTSRRSACAWNGERRPADGLLLWAEPEQALGDTILFARFAAMARERVGHVAVECEESLRTLVGGIAGIDETIARGSTDARRALEAPLMGLPRLFGTTADTIPGPIPYAAADPARTRAWRARLEALPGLRVGLCWRGNPRFGGDRTRSPGLAPMAPLFAVPGISLVALVKDRGPGESLSDGILDPMAEIRDFAETAALLSALDLVVTSDTAVANLAGALGLDAWIILQHTPDWRWMLSGERTPWFPTLRLWRQDRPGDWTGVIRRVAEGLASGPEASGRLN
ncbi:MAG: hypothetical protein JNL04_06510 [Rhodospirillaceae bacterium]|nr:hypothetical protein [Rhodospirillaceae bacterium]